MSELRAFIERARLQVDSALALLLADVSPPGDPGRLGEAMRYAVLGGGKRLCPALVLAAAAAVGDDGRAMAPACAVELLHAYTLVHDDLPAMDDDAERRGRPTVHVAFGEATAILCGDALLTQAFAALAPLGDQTAAAVQVLARRAGSHELLAGQCRDLAARSAPPGSLAELERIHAEKTGALFAAAAELGGIAAGADAATRRRLADYGLALGIAFQHADDLADGDQPEHAAAAAERLGHHAGLARSACAPLDSRILRELASWVEHRLH
jgi:geranylgeranyl pyrophosphate synthase